MTTARPSPPASIEISFLVAARNVAPYIEAAVRSALNQRDCALEVLVVDDGSTDDTAEIVRKLGARDGRVRLLHNAAPLGVAAARNRALREARGAWVAVLDGDDEILPDRTRSLIDGAALLSADIMADNLLRFGPGLKREAAAMPLGQQPYRFRLQSPDYLRRNLMMGGGVTLGYLKPIFRRSFLDDHGLAYDESLRIGEDFQLCMAALLSGARFFVTSEPSYRYRVRSGSLSWRLSGADVDALHSAFATLAPAIADARSAELSAAAGDYLRSLDRARSILGVVDHAKTGRLLSAIRLSATCPESWRFFAAVALRLMGRTALRRMTGAPA